MAAPAGPALRDIHLPAEPALWPPAPGWWLLAAIVVVLVAYGIHRLVRHVRRHRRHAQVLHELETIVGRWRADSDDVRLAADLSRFLRRLGRAVDPSSVAWEGRRWIEFLDRHGDGFDADAASLLDAPYRAHATIDADGLVKRVDRHVRRVLDRELADV
jgi:hypothetical protein